MRGFSLDVTYLKYKYRQFDGYGIYGSLKSYCMLSIK